MKLVTNPYLIRMNQDRLGLQAYVAARSAEAYVLVKDAETRFGTSRYVAIYNAGDAEREITVTARALDLGGRIAAFDLVERADVGEFEGEVCVKVRPHAAKFYLMDAERRVDRETYEAESAYLTDYSEIGESVYGSREDARSQGRAYHEEADGASGGVAVVNLGGRATNDIVWKDVHVGAGGRYRLEFLCAAAERREFQMQVDGGAPQPLESAATGGRFSCVAASAELGPGTHSIRLFNASAPMPDVDAMILRPWDGKMP